MLSFLKLIWNILSMEQKPLSPNMQKRYNRALKRANEKGAKYHPKGFWFHYYRTSGRGRRLKIKEWVRQQQLRYWLQSEYKVNGFDK